MNCVFSSTPLSSSEHAHCCCLDFSVAARLASFLPSLPRLPSLSSSSFSAVSSAQSVIRVECICEPSERMSTPSSSSSAASADEVSSLRSEVSLLKAQLADAVAKSAGAPLLDLSTRTLKHFAPPPHLSSPADLSPSPAYSTLLYRVDESECVAYVSLNRPSRLNAIIWPMPLEIQHAVHRANVDPRVKSIVLAGQGDAFCSGYDLKHYAEGERGQHKQTDKRSVLSHIERRILALTYVACLFFLLLFPFLWLFLGSTAGSQCLPWDGYIDYSEMKSCTDMYMSLFHSHKPTIAAIHGFAVAGGSDIALCCDLVIATQDCQIGYVRRKKQQKTAKERQ